MCTTRFPVNSTFANESLQRAAACSFPRVRVSESRIPRDTDVSLVDLFTGNISDDKPVNQSRARHGVPINSDRAGNKFRKKC